MAQVPIERLLGMQVSLTAIAMRRRIIAVFEAQQIPLSFEDWHNLLPLFEKEGVSQKELAFLLGKDKTTISRQVKAFEERGLIMRKADPEDQRASLLFLTNRARKYHDLAMPLIAQVDLVFKNGLSGKELETLSGLLQKIKTNAEDPN